MHKHHLPVGRRTGVGQGSPQALAGATRLEFGSARKAHGALQSAVLEKSEIAVVSLPLSPSITHRHFSVVSSVTLLCSPGIMNRHREEGFIANSPAPRSK